MHRFTWDMRFDPIDGTSQSEGGAVPHRTYLVTNTPWAPPGAYTSVRLVADGKTYTQPLVLVLDPRVKTPAAADGAGGESVAWRCTTELSRCTQCM